MKKALCAMVAILLAGTAYAELKNVEVGGQIRIRGRYWYNVQNAAGRELRWPAGWSAGRPIGPYGVSSVFDFNRDGGDMSYVEHRTLLHIKADFTDNVSAVIDLDSYDRWGEDFRSNYVTGVDNRAVSNNDVEIIQSYIDVNEMCGQPIRLRIGRQELAMGKGFLVSSQISPTLYMTYDGIRATYTNDDVDVDAWWTKLTETSPLEEDGEVDFYGVYATYKALEPIDFSAYWLYVRDGQARNGLRIPPIEYMEKVLGFDQYDPTNLHTLGLRAWGASSGFDYDLEAAYQFGNADAVGSMFPVTNMLGTYGDDEAEFSSWAGDLEVGYKFDVKWAPRVFVGANYFGGEDNRDITFLEWLNPLGKSNASVSFNRLFSGIWYTSVLDILNAAANLSNFWSLRYGVAVAPSEKITAGVFATYFATVDEFAWSPYFSGINGKRAPYFPGLSFITNSDTPDDIGTVSHLWMRYAYSPSLWIKIGWEHLFSGDAVYDGSFVKQNGLDLMAGSDDADADYLYFDTEIKF